MTEIIVENFDAPGAPEQHMLEQEKIVAAIALIRSHDITDLNIFPTLIQLFSNGEY